jgi:nucleoside-diphosphate-sugar epimerase
METPDSNSVLVTGARGFIGRAVRKLLQRSGYSVLALDQREAAAPGTSHSSLGGEIGIDITDQEQLRSLFQARPIAAIVHLAAILPTMAQREPARATQVNVGGSLNLLEMARQFGARRFIFGSSLSVYGTCPAEQVVTEMDRAAPEDLYGAAKLYVEQLGEAYRQAHGLAFISLRIGRVVGAGARSATSAWRSDIFERLGTEGAAEIEIPYAESERILLVHVEDVAEMFLRLLRAQRPTHGVYNGACESAVVGELKRELERLNPRLRVKLAGQAVVGNPRQVDWTRIAGEFGVRSVPIFEQLDQAAGHRE